MAEVTYTLSAFKRARFIGGERPMMLQSSDDAERAFRAFALAIEESNETMAAAENDGLFAQVDGPVLTPAGPMAMVRDCEPGKALEMMLQLIARGLEKHGISGTLSPHREAPPHAFENQVHTALGAVMLLPVDRDYVARTYEPMNRGPIRFEWGVEAAATREVLGKAVDWLLEDPGSTTVMLGGGLRIAADRDSLLNLWLTALRGKPRITVSHVAPDGRSLRRGRTDSYGFLLLQDYSADRSREQTHRDLASFLRATAPQLATGFVREGMTSDLNRHSLLHSYPPQALVEDQLLILSWLAAPLEGEFVYDAFVQQVLTGPQLAKTHRLDPQRWEIQPLEAGRHLVSHRRPDLWYDNDPTPLQQRTGRRSPVANDVLAQARADFGPAILTAADVERNPPAVPREEQARALAKAGLTVRV